MESNLLSSYLETRQTTEKYCEPLQVEDYVPQVADFASPPKWHLAHVTWFFEEMILKQNLSSYAVFDDDYGFLFNSYYQTIGERALRSQRGAITRPSVADVYQYRQYVDKHMSELLSEPISVELKELVVLGINHEQQHQELLLTDLKYLLSFNPTFPVYQQTTNLVAARNKHNGWLTIEQGLYDIGHQGDGFYFDNEVAKHKVYLAEFEISKSLITNADYIEFIQAGGYQNFQFWLDEGWTYVQEHSLDKPLYWLQRDGEWFYYTLAGLQPLDPQAILCHVSYFEANAFANWRGQRLPTEFEWEVAADQLDWGTRWEWTGSAYQPYPGFSVSEGAVGEYNGKFMVNQIVLRGGSPATSKGHSRSTYRNFFPADTQWQYSGIRLVK
ncbi:ergothioneine biosynthesis protein EgtB [Arenicella sp.]|nr:ergothioneine biosynthesis protein EgtB [Arenicella sp.]